MIDALKPAFTLFQFKDGGKSENLGGHAVNNRKSFEKTDFAYKSKKSGGAGAIAPLSP